MNSRFWRLMLALSSVAIFLFVPTLEARNADVYQRWVEKDVHWIMTAEEAATWKHLTSDSEKDVFVEQFWSRRNPVQGSSVNSFKQEHYRRIAYANVHFASSIEGDLSDRGRAYIVYGNPSARRAESEKVHGQEFPSETWEYPGKVTLEFVDRCHCGEYKLYQPTSWPSSVSQ